MKKIKILDCTLRDGGYYNNWNFQNKVVKEYIDKINKSNIDVVEIGFRFLEKKIQLGPFAFATDQLIKNLRINKKIDVAIMVNASDLINPNLTFDEILKKILNKKKFSPVRYIRIAAHFHEIESIIKALKIIKKLGYEIILNIMQSAYKKENIFKKTIEKVKKSKSVKLLYFADSLGSMTPDETIRICKIFKKYWKKDFGFHSHDNCGDALSNCLAAKSHGANWLDCTIQGMGRGAGNVKTEILLTEINELNKNRYNLKPIYELAEGTFKNLKKKFKWGSSLYYYIAAKKNIHPTYIQSIQQEDKYSTEYIIKLLDQLSKINAGSFDQNYLKKYYNKKFEKINIWNAKDWCLKSDILILAQGDSVKNYKKKIIQIANKKKLKILSLNINNHINQNKIHYYLASNYERILLDFPKYSKINKPLIIPKNIHQDIIKKKTKSNILYYGLKIKNNKFDIFNQECALYTNLVASYSLALCIVGGAKNIYLAGFDGYKDDKKKNDEMKYLFKKFHKKFPHIKIRSLTPTIYI
jgi:4-hydroxy 2-oxovalerate aldolase